MDPILGGGGAPAVFSMSSKNWNDKSSPPPIRAMDNSVNTKMH